VVRGRTGKLVWLLFLFGAGVGLALPSGYAPSRLAPVVPYAERGEAPAAPALEQTSRAEGAARAQKPAAEVALVFEAEVAPAPAPCAEAPPSRDPPELPLAPLSLAPKTSPPAST
jgi:hypothetical protein